MSKVARAPSGELGAYHGVWQQLQGFANQPVDKFVEVAVESCRGPLISWNRAELIWDRESLLASRLPVCENCRQ